MYSVSTKLIVYNTEKERSYEKKRQRSNGQM